nr:MAG: hypothetical protein [Bee densovirus 1]
MIAVIITLLIFFPASIRTQISLLTKLRLLQSDNEQTEEDLLETLSQDLQELNNKQRQTRQFFAIYSQLHSKWQRPRETSKCNKRRQRLLRLLLVAEVVSLLVHPAEVNKKTAVCLYFQKDGLQVPIGKRKFSQKSSILKSMLTAYSRRLAKTGNDESLDGKL